MRLDNASLPIGGATPLHVFGPVAPAQRASTDRIFSWYLDLLKGAFAVARTHFVEFRDLLGAVSWQALPSGPHNSGLATDTHSVSSRFYRIRVNP